MVVIQYKMTVTLEIDTETGKSRVISQWGTPLGEGSKMKKKAKVVKEIEVEDIGKFKIGFNNG